MPKTDDTTTTEQPQEEGYVYARDHGKPINVILKEERDRREKVRAEEKSDKPDTEEAEKKPTDTQSAETADQNTDQEVSQPTKTEEKKETTDLPDPEKEALKKEVAEAKQATAKLAEDLKRVEESAELTKAEKVAVKKELKAQWTGRDASGNVVPRDYDEIVAESNRLAEERFNQLFEERRAREKEAYQEQQAQQKAQQEAREESEKKYRQSVETKIENEFSELKEAGILKDADKNELFQMGLQVNEDRIKKGLPVIDSISRIYFQHYKPAMDKKSKEVAGADAPIAGAMTSKAPPTSDKPYVYARDHNKTWAQTLREIATGTKK